MNALPKRVFVIHATGAPRHFDALKWALDRDGGHIEWINLNILRRTAKAFVRRQWGLLPGVIRGSLWLMRLMVSKGETVVIGVPPFSFWGVLILWLRRRHEVIYFSSWPYWAQGEVVKHADSRLWERIWRRALNALPAVGVSKAAAEAIRTFGAIATQIPHCVDVHLFTPTAREKRPGRPTSVLFVGRLIEPKGVRLLLDVARALGGSNLLWCFAGDGPLRGAIEEAGREGLNVRYLGQLSEAKLVEAYQEADIFVLPSFSVRGWEELFGIAIIEAYATGLPAIASACVGPREIVGVGIDGILVPQADANALAAAIQKVAANPSMREEMGARAREKTLRLYSVEVVGESWNHILTRRSGNGVLSAATGVPSIDH